MEKMLVQAQPIKNWTLVETLAAVGNTRIPIQDQPMLKSYAGHKVVIKAIEVITAKMLTNGVLNATANLTRADLIKLVLVLYCDGWEQVQYIPLARLVSIHDTDSAVGTTVPFMNDPALFENLKDVDWTKSYFQTANGTSIATAATIILGVQYQVFNDQGTEIRP